MTELLPRSLHTSHEKPVPSHTVSQTRLYTYQHKLNIEQPNIWDTNYNIIHFYQKSKISYTKKTISITLEKSSKCLKFALQQFDFLNFIGFPFLTCGLCGLSLHYMLNNFYKYKRRCHTLFLDLNFDWIPSPFKHKILNES